MIDAVTEFLFSLFVADAEGQDGAPFVQTYLEYCDEVSRGDYGIIGRWVGSWIYEAKEFDREGCAKWCLRNQECKAFNFINEDPFETIGNCQYFDEDVSIYQAHEDGIMNV